MLVDTVYPPRTPEFTPDVSGFLLLLRVPLVEKELSTHPEHLSSLLMLWVPVTTTGATSREGTVYPFRAPEFTPDVSGFVLLLRVPLATHPEHLSSLLMLVGSCYYYGCH